ncbi:hypothetical protein L9F63_003856 [Diploptera punctata]|uniref:Lipocalin/cytosolic fatty-acid binding domain-containing protein n=1 Tax=Diploptera punctata TaxID=6984 RepID=A0AAD8E9M8_DIPPU|nr:hypothetical protein L9F63_003856 [Diploptera punctata]
MLPILVICLVISSARSCTLPNPLNETIELQDLVGIWYTQYTRPGPPINSFSCWKNVITQEGKSYHIVSSATNSSGSHVSKSGEISLKPGSRNVIQSPDLNEREFEYTVLGLLTKQCVIYGGCLPTDDTPVYYVQTTRDSPDDQESATIRSGLKELDLDLDTFTKNCDNPNEYDK